MKPEREPDRDPAPAAGPVAAKVEALSSAQPFVTIAMPSFNEERHIESCIRSVQAQDYPPDRIEILVADGRSTDGTRAVLARLATEDPRIHMVDNPERLQAAGLNRIIRQARGDVIVRMDVHCEYATGYVGACVEVMRRTGADNVGGAQRARASTRFQRALCAALTSPLGVGGAAYRSADKEGYVDTVFLGAFRRSVFEAVGLYDEGAVTNEDAELNQRLLAAGGKVYLSRDIEVHYSPRDSFRKLALQYFKYGQGRARTLLKHRRLPKLRSLVPFFVVTGGAALVATSAVQPFTLPAFAAYGLATGVEAVRVGRKAGWSAVPVVWAIFPTLHLAHGLGVARGLVRYSLQPDWARS
ncbi:MAG TPA: glycosyltransferase family 2 protein [Kofleriaceae bacterium]|nr:glycosyltransferase family 2 protein [Kofleriaceae bacterium]